MDKPCPCVTVARDTQGSSLRWDHGGAHRDVFAEGELSCVSAGVSQSPAQPSASGPGAEMGLSGSTEILVCLSGLSFMAGSSRNTEGLSRC